MARIEDEIDRLRARAEELRAQLDEARNAFGRGETALIAGVGLLACSWAGDWCIGFLQCLGVGIGAAVLAGVALVVKKRRKA